MKSLRKLLFQKPLEGGWVVRRTIWPFEYGYGTYHPGTRTILDTGLSHQQAQIECNKLNHKEGK